MTTSASERVELGRYTISAGERVIYGQRVLGVVRVIDVPARGRGRRYIVERGLTSMAELEDQLEALEALRALAGLSNSQRRDLSLRVAGFTYREIAAMTNGRTFTNVNKHLVKARAAIRRANSFESGAKGAGSGSS